MANKHRGEIEIELGGKKLKLVPAFDGLVEAEDKSGKGLNEMLNDFHAKRVGIKTIAALIYGGLIGAGTFDYTFERVGSLVLQRGVNRFIPQLGSFLLAAMNLGGDEDEGKQEPAEKPAAKTSKKGSEELDQ